MLVVFAKEGRDIAKTEMKFGVEAIVYSTPNFTWLSEWIGMRPLKLNFTNFRNIIASFERITCVILTRFSGVMGDSTPLYVYFALSPVRIRCIAMILSVSRLHNKLFKICSVHHEFRYLSTRYFFDNRYFDPSLTH